MGCTMSFVTLTWSNIATTGVLPPCMLAQRPARTTLAPGSAAIVPLVSLFYSFIRNSDWLLDVFPLLAFSAGAALFVAFARLLRREARLADKR